MEVRVQKKKNRFPLNGKKFHAVWKILAVVLSVCVLAGGLTLWNRPNPTLAAGFEMDQDPFNRYVFNVVEVVPEVNQAILGFYIDGSENISAEKLREIISKPDFDPDGTYRNFFYWIGKKNSTGNEPFTLIQGADQPYTLQNNEIFKLYILGIGKIDATKSIYENYQANRAALAAFDKEYVIHYKVVTPSGLEAMQKTERDKIHYLHIASGNQITGAIALYNKAEIAWPPDEDGRYSFGLSDDISWSIALELYYRAISKERRMSVSISSSPFRYSSNIPTSSNLYRLYQMLNYADNPAEFQNWFKDGSSTNKHNYIDKNTGHIHIKNGEWSEEWTDGNLNSLPWNDVGGGGHNKSWREGSYISKDGDNILIYKDEDQTGYLDTIINRDFVKTIIDFENNKPSGGNPPEEPEEGTVKVLEIEPCNSYWLSVPGNLSKLSDAIKVDEDDISVTYVTPNTLNGMAVDLAAEFDLILVGDDVSLLSNNSGNGYSPGKPYSHIGFYRDAVKTQTLLNGLLKDDYYTKKEFDSLLENKEVELNVTGFLPTPSTSPYWNPGIRKQWGSEAKLYYLKNVELSLMLGENEASASSARFSGNDLSRHMQRELAQFVKSGQPVVIADSVRTFALQRINEFNEIDIIKGGEKREPDEPRFDEQKSKEDDPATSLDARICFALAGVEDEREYYDSGKTVDTEYLESGKINIYDWATALNETATITLMTQSKPGIQVIDTGEKTDEDGNIIPTVIGKGEAGQEKPVLTTLYNDNKLTFNYEIVLPSEDNIKDCIMTVVVDQNGDGIFDEEGEGKTVVGGKKGKQNNSTDVIKNDKVYEYRFSEKQEGTDYSVETGIIKGTFISNVPVDSNEEICQFRVAVTASEKKSEISLKGVWTGYMRPQLATGKEVKILQIYSKETGGKDLSENRQFVKWIEEAEKVCKEYSFKFDENYTAISEAEFSQRCKDGDITDKSLSAYDLIIVGTDFSSVATDKIADIDELEAIEVLKNYTDVQKKPIIFTNDSMSYVNSENYITPEERKYYYRYLTIEEGKRLAERGELNLNNGNLKKAKAYEKKYEDLVATNIAIQKEKPGYEKDGTVYLDAPDEWLIEESDEGSYNAVYLPVTGAMAEDGRDAMQYRLGSWWNTEKIGFRRSDVDEEIDVRVSQIKDLLGNDFVQINYWLVIPLSYFTTIGYVTRGELEDWYYKPGGEKLRDIQADIQTGFLQWENCRFLYKDIHSKFRMEIPISEKVVDTTKSFTIAGVEYYNFTDSSGGTYLATKSKVTNKYKEVWQIKEEIKSGNDVDEVQYALTDVAGKAGALYPVKNKWNYLLTQSMRYIIGMDRFAVTTDLEPENKRDSGSSRRWAKRTAIQGFTNAALLEYAYLPPEDAAWGNGVNTKSPYADPLLKLGTAPRTNRIEMLNEGTIGLYPFSITNENYSNQKIEIAKNHAPLYQLDLERETGEGKIDDVTVWFTFAGAGDGSSQQEKNESKYFDTTVRDARNNYYLYSKGKIYYTGFSLYDVTEGTESEDAQLVPDMEMKLFINTIYAALNSETEETTYYDTVVREGGTVSGIELAQDAGAPNRYTCYYDEYDETLELSFRVQKISAADGETTPLTIGKKGEKGENGLPAVNEFNETVYTLTGLPEENGVSNFPVVKIAGEQGTKGSMGSGASDIWYTLRFTWDKGEGKIPDDIDGMTMIIGPKTAETGALRQDCIYAEIRFVKRNLFELD